MLKEKQTIIIEEEDGSECSFVVFEEFKFEGQRYLTLVAEEDVEDFENGNVDKEVTIIRIEKGESGEDELVEIEDDEEFERVCNYLDALQLKEE
jgi:uncharacterized protein YrzB (UPF0473 family)